MAIISQAPWESIQRPGQALTRWGLGHALPRVAISARARRGDLQSRLILRTATEPELPLDLFDQIRDAGAFYRGELGHVTARHAVVKEVLTSPDLRSGIGLTEPDGLVPRIGHWAFSTAPLGPLTPPSLLVSEPPDHTRMRKLVTRVFSAKAVNALRERAERIAAELLDQLQVRASREEPVDLVESYASLLPVTMICQILGVPPTERDRVLAFGSAAAPSLDLGLGLAEFWHVESALRGFDRWLRDHVEHVRREPGEDLLSQLAAAQDDDGGTLSTHELLSTAGLVLAAGFETTVNLLGNGIALLDAHRDQRQALLGGDASWAAATDEVLRFDPPVLLTGRTVLHDTQIAGTRMRRGGVVTAVLGAANRDPEVFTDPDTFDVGRDNAGDHVSFSGGRHYCLGAALARMEGEVGLRALHERFPDLRVVEGARRRSTRILRGYAVLPALLS